MILYKQYVVMWHIISIGIGLIASTIQTERILRTGKEIKWTSIIGGAFVMMFSLGLVIWHRKTMLDEIRKIIRKVH
jgi:hypothetical protein